MDLSGVSGEWRSRRPDLDFSSVRLGEPNFTEDIQGGKQDDDRLLILQDAVDDLATFAEDLAGQRQPFLEELLELHPHQGFAMLLLRLQQAQPDLDAPG